MAQDKKTAKALREERADLIKKAQDFATKHEGEDGMLSAEDQGVFNTMIADAQAFDSKITYRESREKLDADVLGLGKPALKQSGSSASAGDTAPEMIEVRNGYDVAGKPSYRKIPTTSRGSVDYQNAFNRALTGGKLSPDEFAALQSDSAEQAGYLLASEQFSAELLKNVDDECLIRQYANITTVPEADSLGIRKRTAKAATFAWSSELAVSTDDSTLAYGKKVLTPHPATGAVKVSRDLLRRSAGLAESEVRYELARDAGELMENAYLTGTGNQRPLGVFTASADGISTARDVATGSTTNYTADKLKKAKYTLKPQYRRNGGSRSGARWMFHRDGMALLSQLKDGNGQYLLNPGRGLVGSDSEDMLLDIPVDQSEFAPNTFTTGLYVGILACWQYYRIADALNVEVQVLQELYAATNQIGYIGRLKTDGLPVLEEAFVRLILS